MKDPAFLFYSSDFLSGTMLMTDEEIGQYIKLLCLQHQKRRNFAGWKHNNSNVCNRPAPSRL